jgi:L-threonylcarbamoyladenylate synthase
MLDSVATIMNEKIKILTEKFWPGPLTLILKKKEIVPYIVTSGLETVAVRMPNNKVALKLINELGRPIAAPSANNFSQLSPTKAEHVAKQLDGKIDLILDGGKSCIGVESTIIEVTDNSQFLLRPGGIAKEEIEKLIGKLEIKKEVKNNPSSPGQLHIHYAPNVPIQFYDENKLDTYSGKKIGGIFFRTVKNIKSFKVIKILSENNDLHEAASNLFSHLHYLESQDLDLILVEPVEQTGLGIAIMDRLTKAVNKYM